MVVEQLTDFQWLSLVIKNSHGGKAGQIFQFQNLKKKTENTSDKKNQKQITNYATIIHEHTQSNFSSFFGEGSLEKFISKECDYNASTFRKCTLLHSV